VRVCACMLFACVYVAGRGIGCVHYYVCTSLMRVYEILDVEGVREGRGKAWADHYYLLVS